MKANSAPSYCATQIWGQKMDLILGPDFGLPPCSPKAHVRMLLTAYQVPTIQKCTVSVASNAYKGHVPHHWSDFTVHVPALCKVVSRKKKGANNTRTTSNHMKLHNKEHEWTGSVTVHLCKQLGMRNGKKMTTPFKSRVLSCGKCLGSVFIY